MPLYQIPYFQRVVNVTKGKCFPKKTEIMHVDAVGIFLIYDEESQKNVNFIRKHLVCRENGKCFIEAGSARKAIHRFYIKFKGARTGGQHKEAKALWINQEEYIYELPSCELLHKNRRGEFICGRLSKEDDSEQGEWGMCVLEGYSSPENCVISEFYRNWKYTSTVADVEGFKVVQPINYCYKQ
mgnify:FL=1